MEDFYRDNPFNQSINLDRVNRSVTYGLRPPQQGTASDLIKMKDNEIKDLKTTLKVYKRNTIEQNEKLSSQDHLYIDYNSLKKNYEELEKMLNQYKAENFNLKTLVQKQNTINEDFHKIFFESKEKFNMYEENNLFLKNKIIKVEKQMMNVITKERVR